MATSIAFHVRADAERPRIRLEPGEQLTQEPGALFYQVDLPASSPLSPYVARTAGRTAKAHETPANRLSALSRELGVDAIWLGFQSVVDAFCYAHWASGACVRLLVYGCEGAEPAWERVEGTTEPWERAGLFEGDAPGLIRPGDVDPMLDAREAARAVAEHFRFAGWELASGAR